MDDSKLAMLFKIEPIGPEAQKSAEMGGGRRIGMGCSPPVPSLVELQTPSFVPLYRGGGRGRGGLDTHPVAGARRVGPIH